MKRNLPRPAMLRVARLTRAQAAVALADNRLLALVGFGESTADTPADIRDPRIIRLPLVELASSEPSYEAWYGVAPVATSDFEEIVLAADGHTAFGCIQVQEAGTGGIEVATETAYRRIAAYLQFSGYSHLLRVWHVLGDITGACGGDMDRYKVFCRARYGVLVPLLAEREKRLPAASAVGGHVSGLTVHFLAARAAGQQIENPRQMSAFHYPPVYGPRSPSFSRAILVPQPEGVGTLLISGTASIVGHRSRHEDDVIAQFNETVINVEALLAAAGREESMRLTAVRVYLRPAGWAEPLRALLMERFGNDVPAVILQADICRPELMLEIEGVAHAGGA